MQSSSQNCPFFLSNNVKTMNKIALTKTGKCLTGLPIVLYKDFVSNPMVNLQFTKYRFGNAVKLEQNSSEFILCDYFDLTSVQSIKKNFTSYSQKFKVFFSFLNWLQVSLVWNLHGVSIYIYRPKYTNSK